MGTWSRTAFDLMQHQKHSKRRLTYLDPETNERYIPYVVEPSVGAERLLLLDAVKEEELSSNDTREVLKIHPTLAPYKAAVLPLVKKYHSEKANLVYDMLRKNFDVTYDDTQSIGKRYRRQDAIGTPFCITIDNDTLEENTVTIRYRDSMEQERVKIDSLETFLFKHTKF